MTAEPEVPGSRPDWGIGRNATSQAVGCPRPQEPDGTLRGIGGKVTLESGDRPGNLNFTRPPPIPRAATEADPSLLCHRSWSRTPGIAVRHPSDTRTRPHPIVAVSRRAPRTRTQPGWTLKRAAATHRTPQAQQTAAGATPRVCRGWASSGGPSAPRFEVGEVKSTADGPRKWRGWAMRGGVPRIAWAPDATR